MLPAGPPGSAARVVWDVSEQGQVLLAVLFPHLAGLHVHRVEDAGDAGIVVAAEVLGVDDFARAKGYVYGTVLVDMRTADVIDLLPDREAASFEGWLTAHP